MFRKTVGNQEIYQKYSIYASFGSYPKFKPSNLTDQKSKEQKAYQVVQILKNDIMDETPSSDGDFEAINDTATHRKTKKSLFATLIKRKHQRPNVKITKKIETCSTINFETDSAASEQNLARYQFTSESEKCWQKPASITKVSSQSENKHNFFQKIVKRSNEDKNSAVIKKNKKSNDATSSNHKILANVWSSFIPTAYIPKYNIKLINGMSELQDILQNLHHSEQHMVHLLKKYIEDKNFQKQLIDTSFEYFALQYDSKCHANILADKIWFQQLEQNKTQDYNLQKRLNFLVKSNRSLQLQIEILCRHCEKLASRNNLYPKRFLHMRSFGKIYARHLIENNRKLHNKVKALTGVISDFEDELHKLQHQKGVLEEEKRSFRSQIYHLQTALEQQSSDFQLEKSDLALQLNHQDNLIKDAVSSLHCIFQDLHGFGHQLNEFEITVMWPQYQYQNSCLPEMAYQLRGCVGELFLTMTTAFKNITLVAKDVNKLRTTNARLQENLQKSTSELDNLSKRLEKNPPEPETQFKKFEKENIALKLKLENAMEQIRFLRDEIENKKKCLSMNNMLQQNQSFSNQIDEMVLILSQLASCSDLPKEFQSHYEKLDYLKHLCTKIVTLRKQLNDKCNNLEEENQNLVQTQQMYHQDIATLQDGLTILSAENENLKKQLATHHQTLTTLQNERIKYLEEKNILKTIFQHLKSEISRVQQLEDAVADMSKETNRLSLIAEFNKQLGEQLKNEVEVKENTITELKQSLEKLSYIQIDTDKERMTLCAQLSEISTVKEKLSDCLELELKKNLHLDETKKKLENSTKSQLKIYEEMQKNERAALKELLKDFKNLIKQRDCLLHLQEENKKKCRDMEKAYVELKKAYESALMQINNRDEEINRLVEKIQSQAEQIKQTEEDHMNNNNRYEKNLRKLEKVLSQMRNEKEEALKNVTYLQTSLQKAENDLNESKEKLTGVENKLAIKTAECTTLESEVSTCKNDLQNLSQENGKLTLELDYLKKLHEQKTSELKETLSSYSAKDNQFLETQTIVWNKEQQINDLNRIIIERESEIKQLQQECLYLKKQTEDQNKVLIGYENQLVLLQDIEAANFKLEKEMDNVKLEHKTTQVELENARKEIDNLNNELKSTILKTESEKSYYKNQANEIIVEYSEQKANIEDEIDSISEQLQKVTENLQIEKERFDELAKAHEELQMKYIQLRENYSAEVNAHKETRLKIENLENYMNAISTERDNLQQQVHLILMEVNEEKDSNVLLTTENKKLQMILEQGRQQYGALINKNSSLEEEVKEMRKKLKTIMDSKDVSQNEINKTIRTLEEKSDELKTAKETIDCLKKELNESQKTLFDLKEDFFNLQQHVTGLEFKNCELTLQLHETQGKLETERNLYKELKTTKNSERTQQKAPSECGELFF
ncbi:putative leucine-rich repeat-containing protein DDB_G0290503 isoform X2 [Tribolium madens]|uniref:putative leucine-rich repeat-containing protein DDB_G0290503 isoform X2 n=1 Tax=Tribolium madens TaxID=41895 RepID=UPI001CF741B9|nr:putative leucine-rich repeat-containing protein DDB_G0290503 isoform X2 [Tribolium madens]